MRYACLLLIALMALGCGGEDQSVPAEGNMAGELSDRIDPSGATTDPGVGQPLPSSDGRVAGPGDRDDSLGAEAPQAVGSPPFTLAKSAKRRTSEARWRASEVFE